MFPLVFVQKISDMHLFFWLNVQAVDHPYLVVYSQTSTLRGEHMVNNATDDEQVCGICREAAEDPAVSLFSFSK